MGDPDRVNRRQVDDVETEIRELGQHCCDTSKPAPRAGKELVPGTESGELTIDVESRNGTLRRPVALTLCELRCSDAPLVDRAITEQRFPFGELAAEVSLAAGDLAVVLVEPGCVGIQPRLEPELPRPERVGNDGRLESVVALRHEDRFLPASLTHSPESQNATDPAMAVSKDRRRREDRVADARLDGISASVDTRVHVLNLDS